MNRYLSIAMMTMVAAFARAENFQITITDTGPQPLSPLFFSTSTDQFNIVSLGGLASPGIKSIAETGNAAPEDALAASAGSIVGSHGVLGASPLAPGLSRTFTFSADAAHPYFSFASMLGKTNDGFIGESVDSMGLMLFNGNATQNLDLSIFGTRAWDAGTELNTQNLIDLNTLGGTMNPTEAVGQQFVRVHSGIVAGVGDAWSLLPSWTSSTQLARIQVQAVPEPGSLLVLGVGAVALVRRRTRRR